MSDAKRSLAINFDEVLVKLTRLFGFLQAERDDAVDALFVCTGKTNNEANATSSELLQLWLTGFQFPETLFVFTRSGQWHILTSPKKALYLEPIKKHHPNTFLAHRSTTESDSQAINTMFNSLKDPLVGFLNDKGMIGDFADNCLRCLREKRTVDLTFDLTRLMTVRTKVELDAQKNACILACAVMKSHLINQIENILDSESKESHAKIAMGAMGIHGDAKFVERMEKRHGMVPSEMEVIYSNVQSGNSFALGIGSKPTNENLSQEPGSIIVSVCTKYAEMCACITRTLILDGTKTHKEAYNFCLKVFDHALSRLKVGSTFGSVYKEVHDFVAKEKADYESKLIRNIGHTIGLEFKDEAFTLTNDNHKCVIEKDMVFHISIGFNNLKEARDFAIWISDTVHISGDEAVLLTSINKNLENISYELEEEEEEKDGGDVEEAKKEPSVSSELLKEAETVILQDRLRRRNRGGAANQQELNELLSRQRDLRKKKTDEISNRIKENGGLISSVKEKRILKMDKIRSFSSPEQFTSDVIPHRISVDWGNEVIMFPVNGYHIPLNILTVKNASCNPSDNNRSYTLRINFQVPGSHTWTSRSDINPLPELMDQNSLFIKEVLYRSTDAKHIQGVFRSIKDLIKQVKQRENDADANVGLADQEKIQINKTGRRVVLKDLMARPNLHGSRRVIGFLEAHTNGLRYIVNTRDRVDNIDITYANIRHAIFQPCEKELIVLLHFHLKSPIIVGKRKTLDVQFYSEVGTQIDDLDNRRGRSYNDPDETLEEMRERELRRKLNSDFKQFVTQLQEMSRVKFQLPYRELMFTGVPLKSNVELLPTANCLVHLVEWPPFVLCLDDIEIVSLERVQHGLRNFDIVFVGKDYSKNVKRIDLVPVEYLDVIKRWLTELEIVWYDGRNNLQWTNILRTIVDDVEAFVENGGFDGFLGESDHDEESEEEEEDDDEEYGEQNLEEDEEEEEEDEEDDESLADEDEDEEEEEEDEEEALSWDEMEERAKKADSRQAFQDDRRVKKRR